jgi:tetratricopeptide (TPR) repeat protein
LERATSLRAGGDLAGSIRNCEQALQCHPQDPQALYLLGTLHAQSGELERARSSLQAALGQQPGWPAALGALGNVHKLAGDASAAVECYREALRHKPESPFLLTNLGAALSDLGQHRLAVVELRRALVLKPDFADAHHNLGAALKSLGEGRAAAASFRLALRHEPGHSPTLKSAVSLLLSLGAYQELLQIAQQALAVRPGSAEAMTAMGLACRALGRPAEALQHLRAALQVRPDDAHVLNTLGIALQDLGRLPEAVAAYDHALRVRAEFPSARWHRALARLLDGDFERGWPDYELRLVSQDPPPRTPPAPRWDGNRVDGTVLVYAEQGLGDEIMFASCLSDVLRRTAHCVVDCSPKLEKLFRRSFPQATVLSGEQRGTPSWERVQLSVDQAIPAGSLPMHLRRDRASFPRHDGYLRADPARVEFWRGRLAALGTGLKVGISWCGGTARSRRAVRSIPLAHWSPLLRQEPTHFVSLQYTECTEEIAQLYEEHGVEISHWPEAIEDYDETAALICALDLVISVQTSVIHLCGALGRTAWVLVSASPEWRYLNNGETLPWYPSVRLFRQPQLNSWDSVITSVAQELHRLISQPIAVDFPAGKRPEITNPRVEASTSETGRTGVP